MTQTWTKEQEQAIRGRGKDMLVSAAAGSGKTAVLVERIINKITDEEHPADIDRLLVVTFTKAAASEMRSRIRDELQERAQNDPENERLQRQLVLVHNAKITTIDSFCQQVLRSHFQAVGIDPSFRVADEGEAQLLEQDVVKEIVNEAYEQDAGEGPFTEFLEQFATGRDDSEVEGMILKLYRYALGEPYPERWLQSCREMYEGPADWKEDAPVWMDYLVKDTALRLKGVREKLEEAWELTQESDGPSSYAKAIQADLELTERLMTGSSYETYSEQFRQMGGFTSFTGSRDARVSAEKRERVSQLRADCKAELTALKNAYFYEEPGILQENYQKSGVVVRVLTELTEAFMARLSEKKAEKNILDFSDLEHLTLRALENPDVAGEYAETFEEVMTDEYQDINLVQEMILQRVSGRRCGAHNRFMVGDVKQSIYRFRLARPELFMEKYHEYPPAAEAAREEQDTDSCRIDLHQNFRSRTQVLDTVNGMFVQLMTEPLGGIAYDEDAALYPGAAYPDGEMPRAPESAVETPRAMDAASDSDPYRTELLLMDGSAKDEDDDSSGNSREEEARMVGKRILEIVGTLPVLDQKSGELRPARYGDIVLLFRAVSGWTEIFGEVFADMGIPCYTGSQKGYFSAAEVRVVLSYLQILDNPLQDIPLAAVLRSAIGKLTDEELAQIRIAGKADGAESFYDCCRNYAGRYSDTTREKLDAFFAVYDDLRAKSEHTPVHQLLWELMDVTGYGDYAASLPAGRQRKANLDMLVEKAIAYEATSYRGLYHFVRYIENLQKYEVDYGEANTLGEAEDTVRMLSIHKSKGLEFPIVFVCGLGKKFNKNDVQGRIVMHSEWGIACDCIQKKDETGPRMQQATLLKKAIQQKLLAETLGEELRILYVAMTRAKEKLILTGSVQNYEKRFPEWEAVSASGNGEAFSYSRLISANTYLDWVVPAFLQVMEEGDLKVCTASGNRSSVRAMQESGLPALEELVHLDPSRCRSERAGAYLEEVFSETPYPASDQKIPGKLTVSELKKQSRQAEDEPETQELYPEETVVPLIPKFRTSENRSAMDAASRGTLYHKFLENLDFSDERGLRFQLEELVDCGKISRDEAPAIRLEDFEAFLHSEIGYRMKQAALEGKLYREQPFVLGVPAEEIYGKETASREMILVQGIIDAFFEEDGQITVVDYKTDRVGDGQVLLDRYRVQLEYYAKALRRLKGMPVGDAVIYSFCLRKEFHLR